MHCRPVVWITSAIISMGVCPIALSQDCHLVQTEDFETPDTLFEYTPINVPYVVQDDSASHTGAHALRVNPSTCPSSCFDDNALDLVHTFDEPVMLLGVELWAREASTTGSAWGGKIRVGHDAGWALDFWGIVDNNDPTTGEWQHKYVPIGVISSHANIRVWDITNRSTIWLDDITLYYSTTSCGLADLAPPCGVLDFSDVLAFLVAFAGQQVFADLAPSDGVFDFSDVIGYLNAFDAGCP
ncbi:MAG: GC-type dockerin domain-anchored protein [Phycisphaerales bacterium]